MVRGAYCFCVLLSAVLLGGMGSLTGIAQETTQGQETTQQGGEVQTLQSQEQGSEASNEFLDIVDESTRLPTIFSSTANYVMLDTVALDNRTKQPMLDLTVEDFEIFENGERQNLEILQIIYPPSAEDSSYVEGGPGRLFVIFIDDYQIPNIQGLKVRRHLTEVLRRTLRPEDVLGVMLPLTSIQDIFFTKDHNAIFQFLTYHVKGREFDYTPTNVYERNHQFVSPDKQELLRAEISLSALEALMVSLDLNYPERRKHIFVLSNGWGVPPPLLDVRGPHIADTSFDRTGGMGYNDTNTLEDFGRIQMDDRSIFERAERVARLANHAQATIHAVGGEWSQQIDSGRESFYTNERGL